MLQLAIEGKLADVLNAEEKAVKRAARAAIERTSQDLKQRARDQVTGAGLGRRLANTWRGVVYPKSKKTLTLGPATVLYNKAPHIIRSFDRGETVQSQQGKFIAIPTDAAPRQGDRRKRINPSNFPEWRYGPLRFVYRRRGPSLLVVDGVRMKKSGRTSRQLAGRGKTKTGKYKKDVATVVMFLLFPRVRMPKRLNVKSLRKYGQATYARHLTKELSDLDRHSNQ